MTSTEIDQVVADAAKAGVEQAYKEYPSIQWTPLVRIVVAAFAVLVVFATGSSTYGNIRLTEIQKCQISTTKALSVIAQQDRAVVDRLENAKSQLLAKHVPLTDPQWKQIVNDYNAERASNDAQRKSITGKCS